MHSQRGFSLVEILAALALALPLGFALLGIVTAGIRAATAAAASAGAARATLETIERLEAESHGAAAIFTPQSDVAGGPNCDSNGECRELDFFTRDKSGAAHFWAYRYDSATQTIQRFAYDDLTPAGAVNLRASGVPLVGFTGFSARRIPISQIVIPALRGHAARDVVVPFGYPGVSGGNAIVAVDLRNVAFHLRHELVPRLAATGFTIVVGSYAPQPVASSAPSAPADASDGIAHAYVSFVEWRIGPCVGVPLGTRGCGADGNDTGLLAEQNGADFGPGGTLIAPSGSSVFDSCGLSLDGVRDARGAAYARVPAGPGSNEFWYAGEGLGYVAPSLPVRADPGPFAAVIRAGPGYEYITSYRFAC